MYPPFPGAPSPFTSELAPVRHLGVPPPSLWHSQPGGSQFLGISLLQEGYSGQSTQLFIYAWVSSQQTPPVRLSPKPWRHAISSTGAFYLSGRMQYGSTTASALVVPQGVFHASYGLLFCCSAQYIRTLFNIACPFKLYKNEPVRSTRNYLLHNVLGSGNMYLN